MILEIAEIHVQEGTGEQFEAGLKESAEKYISKTEGYTKHELRRSMEEPTRYILLVTWETLDAHMVNFRESDTFPKHRALISPYFAQPPNIQHFELVE